MPVMDGIQACIQIRKYLEEEEKKGEDYLYESGSFASGEFRFEQQQSGRKIPLIYALTAESNEKEV